MNDPFFFESSHKIGVMAENAFMRFFFGLSSPTFFFPDNKHAHERYDSRMSTFDQKTQRQHKAREISEGELSYLIGFLW